MKIEDVAGYIRQAEHVTFIIGAGASVTAGIPTARQLVDRVHNEFPHCLHKVPPEHFESYGRVMGALSPSDRKAVIQPLLDQSNINWGHIALACIIKAANVRRILTFNFDLILERSASLLGMHLPVYDFGVSPTRDIAGLASPAIFHLHGQSYGLRLMNSEEETEAHKEALRPLIADSVRNHLTIIIGYSGEADPAFRVITEEYNSHSTLIWFGYGGEARPHLRSLLEKPYAEYIGDFDFDSAMIALAEQLKCWPPEIFLNPPQHILKELEDVVDYPIQAHSQASSAKISGGLDVLASTRRSLKAAADAWESKKDPEAIAQDAVLSGSELPFPADASEMSDDERSAHAWAAVKAGEEFRRTAKRAPAKTARKRLQDSQAKFKLATEIQPNFLQALGSWGNALAEEGRLAPKAEKVILLRQALEKYDQVLRIAPDDRPSVINTVTVLLSIAESAEETTAIETLSKALEFAKKYEPSFADIPKFTSLMAAVCLRLYQTLKTPDRTDYLLRAIEAAEKSKEVSGDPVYNLACAYSLLGEFDKALEELSLCKRKGVLPSKKHLMSDADLDPIRNDPRFEAAIADEKDKLEVDDPTSGQSEKL